jgi:hypothetical protein
MLFEIRANPLQSAPIRGKGVALLRLQSVKDIHPALTKP